MNQLIFKSIVLVISFLAFTHQKTSGQEKDFDYRKYHFVTEDEIGRMNEVGRDFYPTDPPAAPVRNVAEFERMESVLIRYPFGIPVEIIAEMSQDCNVTTIVANGSQENTVRNTYIQNGVNISNCDFMHAPSDSYWTRDYGPWFVINGQGDFGISNFPYNRPRPNDDDIPIEVAGYLGIDLYGMNLIHTGGNYMTDGMGVSASTDLVYTENPDLTAEDIDSLVYHYLGIETYHVLPDPLGDYIEHIDCWGKFLDVDKVLIGQVPESDPRYEDFEYVADYFATTESSYGNYYQVYRVETPGGNPATPYTNSIILNKKVLVPQTGHSLDDDALAVYEEAMPGYEIIGAEGLWYNTDALHCRTKGIADLEMLYIKHFPLLGEIPYEEEYTISAVIRPYSGEPLYTDSLFVRYKVNNGVYASAPLTQVFGYRYEATIPGQEIGSEVSYYLYAADESGRRETHPFIGSPDPHVFTITDPELPDANVTPDSLFFIDEQQCLDGQTVYINNLNTDADVVINNIEMTGNGPGFPWFVQPDTLQFPYTLNPQDTLEVMVYIPVMKSMLYDFLYDTMSVESEVSTHHVIIALNDELVSVSSLSGFNKQATVSPNPFNTNLGIQYEIEEVKHVDIVVYNLKGQKIKTLKSEKHLPGSYELKWNGKDENGEPVCNGVYVVFINHGKYEQFIKVIRALR